MKLRTSLVAAVVASSLACAWSCSSSSRSSVAGSTAPPATVGSSTPTSATPATGTTTPAKTTVSGIVALPYTLTDAASAPHSVEIEFSKDHGATWAVCAQGPGGEGKTNLASSPAGVQHAYHWDTFKDLGGTFVADVVVRVSPSGQSSSTSAPFDVDNRAFQAPSASVAIARGPYLQNTTKTSVAILWRTAAPTDTVVEWGATAQLGQKAGDPNASETNHLVTISNLTPGTQYTYRILTGGAPATYAATFTTAPDSTTSNFTALVFGDSGSGTQFQYDLGALMAKEQFDLALHTGDVIYPDGAEKDYDPKFFVPYGDWLKRTPIFPAMGNHDLYSAGGQAYFDAFHVPANNPTKSERYYSFEWGNAKFISIETYDTFKVSGPHYTWLQNELASNTRRWLVVYMHVPLWSCGNHGDSPALQAQLQPLFEQYKVDLVLQGHDHLYERTNPIKRYSTDPNYKGVPFIVTGGGGAQWYPVMQKHPETAYAEASYHYTMLTFTNDAIRGRVVRVNGSVAETFTLNHQ